MQATTGLAVPWRITASIVAASGLLLSCGDDGDSTTSSDTESDTEFVSETAATPETSAATESTPDETAATPETTAATESTPDETAPANTTGATTDGNAPTTANDASGGGLGEASVEVDGDTYDFVVIQCLRDVAGPFSNAVIEFQLDAVPAATPSDTVDNLLGVIGEGVDVFAELEPVLEFGPILSITQVQGGGEAFFITDLDTIEITSDGDPSDPASRSLDVSPDPVGARVTGSTTAGGRAVAVDATCP